MVEADTVCGCAVERWLTPGRTALIEAPWSKAEHSKREGVSARLVVKRLDDDLLLGHDLHPLVRDRLAKLRELPLNGVSLPLGVWAGELTDGRVDTTSVWTLWHWVEGRELVPEDCSAGRLSAIAIAAFEALEQLHELGLAHGAVHRGNVLVGKRDTADEEVERVILLHPSPLLVTDMEADVIGLCRVLRDVLSHETGSEPTLRRLMARQVVETVGSGWTARTWRLELGDMLRKSTEVATAGDGARPDEAAFLPESEPDRRGRARRMAWILGTIVVAVAVAGFLVGW